MLLRPHKYQVAIISDTAQVNDGLDENGYPVGTNDGESQNELEWSDPVECRYVTDSKNNVRQTAGGTFIVYSYVVYCDPVDNLIGKRIRLFDSNGNKVYEGNIDGQGSGQLHTTLYIK